jgi:uncharacterized membrane protein YphA (DoxX/SURF4 family)
VTSSLPTVPPSARFAGQPQQRRAVTAGPAEDLSPRITLRRPDDWLAVLRIVVGLWFLKSIFTKLSITLVWGFLPVPVASARWISTMPKLITLYAEQNPFPAYKAFLLDTVVTSHAFAHLTALGEVAVGLSLTLGFCVVAGASIGVVQVILYGLAVQHMAPGQRGFHVMLLAMMLAFVFTRAGRRWGLDGWLRRRHPRSTLARLPLG